MTDLLRDDLVNGRAREDVGAGGFADANAGEEGAARSGMGACPVGSGRGIDVVEAGDDLQFVTHFLERLQGAGELEIATALTGGPPGGRNCAVGDVKKSHADGGSLCRRLGCGGGCSQEADWR